MEDPPQNKCSQFFYNTVNENFVFGMLGYISENV